MHYQTFMALTNLTRLDYALCYTKGKGIKINVYQFNRCCCFYFSLAYRFLSANLAFHSVFTYFILPCYIPPLNRFYIINNKTTLRFNLLVLSSLFSFSFTVFVFCCRCCLLVNQRPQLVVILPLQLNYQYTKDEEKQIIICSNI